jgi:hypothetical protein
MACPCCYQGVASSVVTTKLPATGLTLKLANPSTKVEAIFDQKLGAALNATLNLDSVSFDLSSKSDKSAASATVRPNLSVYGVKLEIYPFKSGNFKISRPFCLGKLGGVDLAYASETARVTGKYKNSVALGAATASADVDFAGGLAPSAVSLALAAGAVRATFAYTAKVPLAGSVFVAGKLLSFGAAAEFVGGQIAAPKLYGKYARDGLAVAAIVALPADAGKAGALELRGEAKCPCDPAARTAGAVLSYAGGKAVASLGGKCVVGARTLATQLSTNGSASVTYGGALPSGSYAVTAKWAGIKLDVPGLTPSLAFELTLGTK